MGWHSLGFRPLYARLKVINIIKIIKMHLSYVYPIVKRSIFDTSISRPIVPEASVVWLNINVDSHVQAILVLIEILAVF
jgi:hypothetical protein